MRKISLLIIFLSFFSLGMSPLPQKPCIVKGKVSDAKTNLPIAGAQIKLISLSGATKASALTGAQGKYEIRSQLPKYGGFYILTASKDGYAAKATKSYFQNGHSYTFNFKLKPTVKPNNPPRIVSITPVDNSTYLAGAAINIQINATDPDNDALQYQFSIGGAVKQPWSAPNIYTWQTSAPDTGAVSIACEVKDAKGVIASGTITLHIINPTVEEILEKVVENYALVEDKKMDVTVTSRFNSESEPFGETIYTRHYFRKPDKQRTDTFSAPERTEPSMTEIQITVESDIYLIDPISHTQSNRNILTELNLTEEQLNQMDEIYHLQDFLNAHSLSRKDNSEDLAKGLVMLETIPNTTNNIYSKLGIQIDYFKGLRTKSLTFLKEDNQDKLKQAIEITEFQKMPNHAWVPKTQIKTLYLIEGNLIMTFNFDNIQINTGLPDYLFDPTKQ